MMFSKLSRIDPLAREITYCNCGSVNDLRPGGRILLGGPPFLTPHQGGRDFFGVWSGGPGKFLTTSKGGGAEFFSHYT